MKCNLLMSYALLQRGGALSRAALDITDYVRVLIDSGAYSNFHGDRREWVQGTRNTPRVTLEDYITACRAYHGHVWQYVALDEIRNVEQTEHNLRVMLDAGLLPMPVWIETRTDFARVPEYMAITPHVCVAGGPRNAPNYNHYLYQQVYKASGGQALIHALGYTRFPATLQLPLHSCDSSTFASGSQFGWVPVFDERRGFIRRRWPDLQHWQADPDARAIVMYMRDCGIPIEHVSDQSFYRGQTGLTAFLFTAGYLNFMRLAESYNILMFLVISTTSWLELIASIWATWTGFAFDYHASLALFDRLRACRSSTTYSEHLCAIFARNPLEEPAYVQY